MARLSIKLFGPFQVTLDGEPVTSFATDKVRALLAYLAVEAHKPHRRESLVGLLWPEQPERAARASLRRALADLRQAIGDREAKPPFLLIDRQTIQFNRSSDGCVDITEFTELAVPEAPTSQTEEAVELYRGSFLEGFSLGDAAAFEEWSLLEREQLNRQMLDTVHRLTDHYESLGDHERALPYAWRRMEADRLQESTHRQLMRLLVQNGQRSTALSQYETLCEILREELGVEPESATSRLFEQIRAGDLEPSTGTPAPVGANRARPVGDCPYRGLAAFRETDAPFFHGRDDFVARLMEAVELEPAFAVVVASSGSGKTSTVFAGLFPRLRDEGRWLTVSLRPGDQPFHSLARSLLSVLAPDVDEAERLIEARNLAAALGTGQVPLRDAVERALEKHPEARRLLLVVDQAEELYTLCPEPEVRRRFLDELLGALRAGNGQEAAAFGVLVTLRADFMGHALTHRLFADALQEGSLMMGPMSRSELRMAIERPTEHQGAAFEAGLVERLLDDVGDEPGNLPLLEFALTLLWEDQTDGWLTHSGYEEIGRVEGALTRYADTVFEQLDERRREDARRVFVQLVRPGEGTEDTRRVATRTELGEDAWPLVQQLADKRLVVTGSDAAGHETVEVVHEALIQRWERLQAWLDTDRSFRTWQESLRIALRGWESSDHDEDALLRGVPLTQAEAWMVGRGDELSDDERDFVRAGLALRERRRVERERRRRRTVLALAGGLLAAIALTVFAFNSRVTAQREAELNRSLAVAADAEQANDRGEGDLALALALEALKGDQPPLEAQRVLTAIAHGTGTRAVLVGHTHAVRGADLSPDGSRALSGSCAEMGPDGACTEGELILWDLGSGSETARFEGHTGWVNDVAFSPDGRHALTASGDTTLILWDIETGETIHRFEGHSAGVNSVAIGSGGGTALSGSEDNTMILWDVSTGEELQRFEGHRGGVTTVAFGPGGTTALSASEDMTMILWDVTMGNQLQRFEGHTKAVSDAAFVGSGPGDASVVSVGDDLSLRKWDVGTGEETERSEFGSFPASLAAHPDGRTALVSVKTFIQQWDVIDWTEVRELAGHGLGLEGANDINSIAINVTGELALSAGSDGTLRLWNLAGRTVSRRFPTDGSTPVNAVALSSDATQMLTGMGTGETLLWDVESGQTLRRFGGGEGTPPVAPGCVALSPESAGEDSALVCAEDISGRFGTSLVLWDLDTGEELQRLEEGHVSLVRAIAFSPGGGSALAGSQSVGDDNAVGDLVFWNLETGMEIRRFDWNHDVTDIAISADGSRALTGTANQRIAILWDMETGREIRRFEGHTLPVLNVAFGPREETVLTASIDRSIIRWNIETGEIIQRYLGHRDWVWGLDVSRDGQTLASSSSAGTVILWDLETGKERRRIAAHTGFVFDVALHPDGESVFSVGADGQIIEWQLADPSLDELLEWVHANRYIRPLACEERELYRLQARDCERSGPP